MRGGRPGHGARAKCRILAGSSWRTHGRKKGASQESLMDWPEPGRIKMAGDTSIPEMKRGIYTLFHEDIVAVSGFCPVSGT